MARVTIEDCLEKVDDRFELVALSAQRARDIASGAELTIDRNDEKDTVISLREIAEETVSVDSLRENIVTSHQKEKNITFTEIKSDDFNNDDSIDIDEEDADIHAAIAAEAELSDDSSDEDDSELEANIEIQPEEENIETRFAEAEDFPDDELPEDSPEDNFDEEIEE
jgi:DNA-directed RNA polymerase subunit omega